MRAPALPLLLSVLSAACGGPRFAPPEPLELEPSRAEVDASVEVVIRGRGFLPRVEADYDERERSRVDGLFGAWLGGLALEDVTFVSTTELRGLVPAGLAPGRYALRVVDPSGAEGHLDGAFQVLGLPAVRLGVATPERTVAAGECSRRVVLEAQAEDGRPGRLEAPLDVTLAVSPPGAVSLFSDPGCQQPLGSMRLEPSEPRQEVYFSGTAPGTAALTATAAPLLPAEQPAHVVPGPVARLVWDAVPSPQRVGETFEVRAVAVDAYGNPSWEDFQAALAASPEAPLRCVTGCRASGRAGFSQGVFSGSVAVDAPARALRLDLRLPRESFSSGAFDVRYPEATALAFTTGAQVLAAGTCSAPVTLELRDAGGLPARANERVAVSLAQTPPGGLALFTDGSCATALGSAVLEPGGSQLTFHFSGQLPGAVDLTASSPGLGSVTQRQQVTAGGVVAFAFDALPSPQRRGADIPVRVRALDSTGSLATSFTGSAVLSLSPAAVPFLCSARCASGTVTAAFQGGVWTGAVRVGAPVGGGRVLTAASGEASGSSAAFTIVEGSGLPPSARLARPAAVVRVGQPVTLDASGSTDPDGNTGLQVSFDPEGGATSPPPWSAWGPLTTTASHTYAAPGLYRPRIAVRDPEGNVGYDTADVLVLDGATPLCVVSDPTGTDEGTHHCGAPNLSLPEALRIANATPGRQVITFLPGLQVSFTQLLTLQDDVDIIAPPGVTLSGPRFSVSSGTVLLSSLTLQSGDALTPVGYVRGGSVRVSDVTVRGSGALELEGGQTRIDGSRFESCASACLVIDDGAGDVRVRDSAFQAPGQNGINIHDCNGAVREILSCTFHDLNKGFHVKARCGGGPVAAVNNTFVRVESAAYYDAGQDHVLVNNIIAGAASGPIHGCTEDFAQRGHNLLWASDPDGCTAADPGALVADPLFIDAPAGDYRLRATSPARDSAPDTGADVTPGSPGSFLGLAPDRGGRETW